MIYLCFCAKNKVIVNRRCKCKKVHIKVFLNRGPYYIEQTSPLLCSANQWTGFCMIKTFVMKELSTYLWMISTATSLQKITFSIKDFFSKCDETLNEKIFDGKLYFCTVVTVIIFFIVVWLKKEIFFPYFFHITYIFFIFFLSYQTVNGKKINTIKPRKC